MKKHKIAFCIAGVLFIVVMVAAVLFIRNGRNRKEPETVAIQTEELQKRNIMNTLSVTGTVESATSKTVTSAMTDTEVISVNVEIGDYVKKGDVICVFDSTDLEEQLTDARTKLNVGQAKTANELDSAEKSLESTKTSTEVSKERAAQSTSEASSSYSEANQKAEDAYAEYEKAKKKADTLKEKVTTYKKTLKEEKEKLSNLNSTLQQTQSEEEKSSLQQEVDNAGAEVESLNKKYQKAQSDYEEAKKLAEEKKTAYDAAKKEADSAKSSYKKATQEQEDADRNAEESISNKEDSLENSRLNAITANLTEADQVESLKEQIEDCTILAPADGVVTALNVEKGEKFAGGDVVTVQDDTSFIVSATVDEYDIADVAKGMRSIIKTDATGEEELDGEITFVSPTPSEAGEGMGSSEATSGYPIEIAIHTANERLRIGMTAKVSIVLDERENVFAVPYDAITTNEAGESIIYVVGDTVSQNHMPEGMPDGDDSMKKDDNGNRDDGANRKENSGQSQQKHAITVTVGMESDYYTEISGDQLVEGMRVVLTTQNSAKSQDGDRSDADRDVMFGGMDGGNPGGGAGGGPGGGGPGGF